MSDSELEVVAIPRAEWQEIKAELAALRREVRSRRESSTAPSAEAVTDRRQVLKHGAILAAGAVTGGVALAVSEVTPAAATINTMQYGTTNDSATDGTVLNSASARAATLALTNSANFPTLQANGTNVSGITDVVQVTADGLGNAVNCSIENASSTASVVRGYMKGLGPALEGYVANAASTAAAVQGYSLDGSGAGVAGSSYAGPGVVGQLTTNPNNGQAAVMGTTSGTGSAIYGQITNGANNSPAIFGTTSGGGSGVYGQALGGSAAAVYGDAIFVPAPGVQGVASDTEGVLGQSGSGPGVSGTSSTGPGVQGQTTQSTSTAAGVAGTATKGPGVSGTATTGNGVYGRCTSGGFGVGVYGVQSGVGSGVRGDCKGGTGVFGNVTSGIGVKGIATTGRGAVFAGQAAQISLTPATAGTHPTSGTKGDLFLDSTARLWLCTVGGTTATWKQVQLA